MEKFDVIIIGGGPSGYAAAMRAIDLDKKVCLIEKDKIGGAAIYNGALSSKTLWEIANKVNDINQFSKIDAIETDDTIARRNAHQIILPNFNKWLSNNVPYKMEWHEVKKALKEAINERSSQLTQQIDFLVSHANTAQFTFEKGTAHFISVHEICITNGTTSKTIYGENVIIATGSRPNIPASIKVDEQFIFTSDGIEHIHEYPKSIVIVGGGVIGCEYATIFANFGQTKVHIIDRQERILPFEDEDISTLVSESLESKGVTIHHEASLVRMEVIDNEVEYELSYPDRPNCVIRVEKALLSVGRVPNHENLHLENAGVKLSKRGVHIGDNDTQTNIPSIYTVGDVSGRITLVNMGEIEGRYAIEKAYGLNRNALNYDNICTIMFLNPEVACIGLNEQNCIEKNIPVKIVKIDYSLIARAIAMRKTKGFFKIIVSNDNEMKILGMRAVGMHASTAIQAVGLLIKMNEGIEALSELVHPHPSIVEGIQECVRVLLNKSIFKSTILNDKLQCYSLVNGVKTPLERL